MWRIDSGVAHIGKVNELIKATVTMHEPYQVANRAVNITSVLGS